jgi:hypothetical protein
MQSAMLVYPMFAMVVLTAVVLRILFVSRVRAVREGALPAAYFRVFQGGAEPEYTAKPSRHLVNLFEAPTLFYAACLAAMATQTGGPLVLGLAWAYVAARLVHTFVHLGRNRLRARIPAYFGSWVVLLALWSVIVVDVWRRAG